MAGPRRHEHDPVREEEAADRMADLVRAARRLQEAVTAATGVLDEAVACGHGADAMPEESAGVADLLRESVPVCERILELGVDQRVTAADADVLVNPVAVDEPDVRVMAQKTRQRMADMRCRAVVGQVFQPASAPPCA